MSFVRNEATKFLETQPPMGWDRRKKDGKDGHRVLLR